MTQNSTQSALVCKKLKWKGYVSGLNKNTKLNTYRKSLGWTWFSICRTDAGLNKTHWTKCCLPTHLLAHCHTQTHRISPFVVKTMPITHCRQTGSTITAWLKDAKIDSHRLLKAQTELRAGQCCWSNSGNAACLDSKDIAQQNHPEKDAAASAFPLVSEEHGCEYTVTTQRSGRAWMHCESRQDGTYTWCF